ncbi:MAG: hypothetical protein OXE57_06220, partial [Alphaproteobacteria bacterium]|nr:hypothetical protein [Alphaproteobacteria bacterium]
MGSARVPAMAALSAALFLTACGGAGDKPRLPSPPGPAPDTGAPLETGGEVAARMADILSRTDSLLATSVRGQRLELPPEVAVL